MNNFTHYCTLVLDDLMTWKDMEFYFVQQSINNHIKYKTFFNMIADNDEECERLDSQYYNTLCMILGLPKHDEEDTIITDTETDILREYIDKMLV